MGVWEPLENGVKRLLKQNLNFFVDKMLFYSKTHMKKQPNLARKNVKRKKLWAELAKIKFFLT